MYRQNFKYNQSILSYNIFHLVLWGRCRGKEGRYLKVIVPLKIFDFAAADLPYSSSRQPDTKCLLSLAQSFMSCASVSFFETNGEQREQTTWLFANPVKILTKKNALRNLNKFPVKMSMLMLTFPSTYTTVAPCKLEQRNNRLVCLFPFAGKQQFLFFFWNVCLRKRKLSVFAEWGDDVCLAGIDFKFLGIFVQF